MEIAEPHQLSTAFSALRWAHVSPYRRFVSQLLKGLCADADHVCRVALTVHELMENAAKYGRGAVKVSIELDERGFASRIEVGAAAEAAHRADAAHRIDELATVPDLHAHYLAMMERAARAQSQAGLGLARIVAEAEMTLSYRDTTSGFVVIARPAEAVGAPP